MATDISKTKNVQADMLAQVQDWMKEKDGLASGLANVNKDSFTLWGTETYNNGGQKAIDDIEAQIKAIDKEIASWEAKLKEYETEIEKINKEIGDTGDKIGDIATDIAGRQNKYEKQLQSAISQAITDAVDKVKKNQQAGVNTTFKETFHASLDSLLDGSNAELADISNLYNEMDDENSTLSKYMTQIDRCIADSGNAMKGLKNAQAIINVLNQQKGNMTAQNDNYYANKNNDAKVPVFSYEKETAVAEIADKYGIELGDRSENKKPTGGENENRDDAKIKDITAQINELGKASTGAGDAKAAYPDNEAMKNLGKALFGDKEGATTVQEGSLIWQLAESGANNSEIMDILAGAFGNLGITKNGDGNYSIPYGHGTAEERKEAGRTISGRSAEIYSAVLSIANNTSGIPEPKTTTPGDAKQLETAMKVVDELAAKGFSFKEAMYTLDQFFPGLDIGYSLGEQKDFPQGAVRFTSDESYTPLAEKIKGYTGKGGKWEDSKVIQAEKPKTNTPQNTNRTDPISIKNGDSRLYFMADDGNGKYDGITDLLGSDNNEGMNGFRTKYGIPEGQNVIEGEEALSKIMMMQLKEVTNPDGSVSVQQSFVSAWDAGITKIDLTPTNQDGNSYNINNTQVQTTFNVTMGGEQLTAEQAMEDDDYISATLENEAVMGVNMFSQLSQADVEKAYNDPLSDDLQKVYDLAEKVNTQAQELKEKAGSGDDLGIDKNSEKDFKQQIKQELDDAAELAKAVGGAAFGEGTVEGADVPNAEEYNTEGEYGSNWSNDKGGRLDEAINDTVIEEMKKKGYDTYGDQK